MSADDALELIEQALLPSERGQAREDFWDLLARIWDEGFDAGERDVWEHEHGSYDDPCIPNPYERNEHA